VERFGGFCRGTQRKDSQEALSFRAIIVPIIPHFLSRLFCFSEFQLTIPSPQPIPREIIESFADKQTEKQKPAILRATPGRILKEEFLEGFNLTQAELSERTGIPRSTVNEIIKGKRPINAETALTLGIFFGTGAQFWLNLQTQFDIRRLQMEKGIAVARPHQAGGSGVRSLFS